MFEEGGYVLRWRRAGRSGAYKLCLICGSADCGGVCLETMSVRVEIVLDAEEKWEQCL